MVSPFAHLEETTEVLYHVDERDKLPWSEEKRQQAFLRDARILCPAVELFAVPNGGKRSQWAAMKAKREGMKAGVCDVVASWPGRGIAWLEFKNGTEMPDANQREFLNRKVRQGFDAGVFRTSESALRWLRACGAPFIGRVAA
jgi:hypothetical protein